MKPSTAKQKGAATETMFVEWLRTHGLPHTERRHLTGAHDEGDIAGWPGVCIEIKSGAKLNPNGWLNELDTETANAHAETGAVVVRPKGKPNVDDWYVLMRPAQWMALMESAGWVAPRPDSDTPVCEVCGHPWPERQARHRRRSRAVCEVCGHTDCNDSTSCDDCENPANVFWACGSQLCNACHHPGSRTRDQP